MNIEELREKLSKVDLLSAYPFVNGYGISAKTNKETNNDELVVQFNVSKKLDSSLISQDYFLPSTLSAHGIDIKTKVTGQSKPSTKFEFDYLPTEEIDYIKKISKDDIDTLIEVNEIEHELMCDMGQDFYDASKLYKATLVSYFNDQSTINENHKKSRPLSGGSSSIWYDGGGDATLGILARDKQDKSIVALSNSHVYSDVLLLGEEAAKYGRNNNMLSLSARQPGRNNFGNLDKTVDHIGIPKRTSILSFDNSKNNFADAAIVELSSTVFDDSSNSVIYFEEKGPYEFATNQEIYSMVDPGAPNYQSPVFRSGRTLGPLGFPGNLHKKTILTTLNSYKHPINLTPFLSTSDSTNIFSQGLSSITVGDTTALGTRQNTGHIFYQSRDRTKVYITGRKQGYMYRADYPSGGGYDIFPNLALSAGDQLELAIEDNNKIKIFGTYDGMEGAFYVNDNDQVFFGGAKPHNHQYKYAGRYTFREIEDGYGYSGVGLSGNFVQPWTELVLNDSDITTPGIKKVYFSEKVSYILTNNNKLFVRGGNFLYRHPVGIEGDDANIIYYKHNNTGDYYANNPALSSIWLGHQTSYQLYNGGQATGYGSQGDFYPTFTQIPGEWLDFACEAKGLYNSTSLTLAISANNRLCAAYHTISLNEGPDYDITPVRPTGRIIQGSRVNLGGSYMIEGLINDLIENSYDAVFLSTTGVALTSTHVETLCSMASFNFTDNVIPIVIDGNEVFVKEILTKEKGIGSLPQYGDHYQRYFELPDYTSEPWARSIGSNFPVYGMPRRKDFSTGEGINLISVNNELINLQGRRAMFDRTGVFNSNNSAFLSAHGEPVIWNETCKKIAPITNNTGYRRNPVNPFFISGGDIFIYGEANYNFSDASVLWSEFWSKANIFGNDIQAPLSAVLVDNFPPPTATPGRSLANVQVTNNSSFNLEKYSFKNAFKYDNFPNFDFISGFFNATDNGYVDGICKSSIVFSDNNGVSAIGYNVNDEMHLEDIRYNSDIIVDSVDFTQRITFNTAVLTVNNNFSIKSKFERFPVTKSGDSGTAVFGLLSSTIPSLSTWKCLGLVYAGPTPANNAPGLCCSIENISNELDIESWQGGI